METLHLHSLAHNVSHVGVNSVQNMERNLLFNVLLCNVGGI